MGASQVQQMQQAQQAAAYAQMVQLQQQQQAAYLTAPPRSSSFVNSPQPSTGSFTYGQQPSYVPPPQVPGTGSFPTSVSMVAGPSQGMQGPFQFYVNAPGTPTNYQQGQQMQ